MRAVCGKWPQLPRELPGEEDNKEETVEQESNRDKNIMQGRLQVVGEQV